MKHTTVSVTCSLPVTHRDRLHTQMHICMPPVMIWLLVIVYVVRVAAISEFSLDSVSYTYPDNEPVVFGIIRKGTSTDATYPASVNYVLTEGTAKMGKRSACGVHRMRFDR